ncbi:MAG TPA: hypothetical protein VKX28_26815 [Xanthobacteraceae bacterium]|nr:hypothetical protein [Xanthobacteraceae bacterium]
MRHIALILMLALAAAARADDLDHAAQVCGEHQTRVVTQGPQHVPLIDYGQGFENCTAVIQKWRERQTSRSAKDKADQDLINRMAK